VITAAALLLVVVVAGFAAGDIMVIKMIGVGLIVGIVVDTTLVRALLVPATMRLFGDWNWWAPGPLLKVYRCCHSREADPLTSGR
jgi:RND superfamily putative drug exporter